MNVELLDAPDQVLWPRVTVVTIVLNAVDIIERTLKSVVCQDYKNLEYVVVDGLSTDGTVDIIEKYRPGITLFVSGKDGGIYPAMNKGAAMASGEWIIFMNGGDVFVSSDAITRTFENRRYQAADVIYGDGIFCHEGKRFIEHAPEVLTLRDGNGFSHQSAFVRATVQKEYGFDISERIAADYDLFLRLYKAGKTFQHVDVIVSEFFTGGFSNLPEIETARLRHRVYKKHLARSDVSLYVKLGKIYARHALRALVPTVAWEGIKRWRDRAKLVSDITVL